MSEPRAPSTPSPSAVFGLARADTERRQVSRQQHPVDGAVVDNQGNRLGRARLPGHTPTR